MEQRSFFGLSEHLERLSKNGDPLETLAATADFEYFRGWLVERLRYGYGSIGGRPPFDPVSVMTMFKALILQAQHNLSDARMEFMLNESGIRRVLLEQQKRLDEIAGCLTEEERNRSTDLAHA
jgi:hypothetical protein